MYYKSKRHIQPQVFFSIRLWSGECDGQRKLQILCSCLHLFTKRALWHGALSSWNQNWFPDPKLLDDGTATSPRIFKCPSEPSFPLTSLRKTVPLKTYGTTHCNITTSTKLVGTFTRPSFWNIVNLDSSVIIQLISQPMSGLYAL